MIDNLEFEDGVAKVLGITDPEKASDVSEQLIDKLDIDDLGDLISAFNSGDTSTAHAIINKANLQHSAISESEEDINSLILRKEDAIKAAKAKTGERKKKPKRTGPIKYNIGDEVVVGDSDGTVKIPSAPGDTVGVMIDGELKMVDKKNIDEAVLGIAPTPGLRRMQELAGMATVAPIIDEEPMGFDEPADMDGLAADDYSQDDIGGPPPVIDVPPAPEPEIPGAGLGDVPPASPAPITPAGPIAGEAPPILPPISPMGDEMDAEPSFGMDDPMGGADLAGALGGDMGGDMGGDWQQHINDLEAIIPDIKVSEYKSLVARLKSLVTMAETTGRSALAESAARAKKAKMPAPPAQPEWKSARKPGTAEEMVARMNSLNPTKVRKPVKEAEVAEDTMFDYDKVSRETGWSVDDVRQHGVMYCKQHKKTDEAGEDADGDGKADVSSRKTLMDYVREQEEMETLGDRMTASKAIQQRLGPKATPQDGAKALDKMKASGMVKQNGSSFAMKPMGDADVASVAGLEVDQAGNASINANKNGNSGVNQPRQATGQMTTPR